MARLRILHLGLALIFIVFIKPNSGLKDDACSTTCRGSQHLPSFRYVEGTTYKYNFESAIEISLSSTKSQNSRTGIKGTALITPVSPCSHLLRLQNVEVVSGDFQRYTQISGIDKPIQFKINDGVLNDHICVEPEDMHNSLNIKRAVASLFQVDTRYEHQTDVFGFCPTIASTSTESGGVVVVTKTKDLDECDFRENIREDFMVSSFNPYSDIKSSPVLSGEYHSKQKIKNGILDKVYVAENYTYLAFTDVDESSIKDNLGAQAKVVTILEYAGTSRDYAQSRVSEAKSIIFDNPHPIMSDRDRSNIDGILGAVRKLIEGDGLTVKERSARDFLDLVKILRDSNKDDMLTAFRQVKAGAGLRDRVAARRVFLDALFKCGTGNAIVVGVELLKNRELEPLETTLVYLSFAFVKHATLSALEAASSLLDTNRLPREAYLGIGNLAGRYCREHQCNVEAVSRLTQRLANKLGYGKAYTRDEENEIIFALKALSNIHYLDEYTLQRVTNIVQDKLSPTRLRVSALDTYLSDACHQSVRNGALHVLKDIQEDSELRIKAYLVLAKCPDRRVADDIKNILDKEPSYQVGGFIVSHLRSLSTSANPDKKPAAHFLGNIKTNKNFPIDPRKYSFNGEFSYDLGLWGMSSSAEANVIYSQNSFLPRSTNLNLTAELFGHTVNFLEVGTRQQNLDRLLEHYFGPMGEFNTAPDELKKTGQSALRTIADHFNQRFERSRHNRGKRDVSKELFKTFARDVQIRTNELNNELDLDLSIKLFGSELFFLSISDDTENLSPDDVIDRFFDSYEQELAQYRRFDKTFHENSLFLDSEFSYPTSLGFPLRLGLEGTASVQVKTKGDIDVAALLDETAGGLFKLSIIPSADIEVAASITLDAQVFESGLKVVSNLHTATGGDLEVNLQDRNRGMEVKFSLPLQKQKILTASHEVVLNSRELGKPEIIQPIRFGENKNLNLCVNDLSPFIGLNLCMDLNSPSVATEENPVLAGNYKFALVVNNDDFSHFHYKEEFFEDYRKTGGQMTAEIIGARQNKKLSFVLEVFRVPEYYIKASVVSPITTASAEVRITMNQHEYSVSYEIKQDRDRYFGKAGVTVSGPHRRRFTPILEYVVPGHYGEPKKPFSVQGSFVVEQNNPRDIKLLFEDLKLLIENSFEYSRPSVFSINGNIGHVGHDYISDVTLSDGYSNFLIKGNLHFQKNVIKLDGQLKNSHDPSTNVRIIYEFKRNPTELDSSLELIHGPDPNSQRDRLTIVDSLIYRRLNDYDYEVRTKNKITYPAVELSVVADYAATPNSLFYDAEVLYKSFVLGSELNLKYSQRVEDDYDLTFQIYDEDDEIELKSKLEIQGDLNRIDNVLVINDQKYEFGGTITVREGEYSELTADLRLKIPEIREELKIYESWKSNLDTVNHELKIGSYYEQYVHNTLKIDPYNVDGTLKITVRDSFNINGFIKESRNQGSGELSLDFTNGQLIKAEITYTTANPTNIRFTLFPDLRRDRREYITITSKVDVNMDSVNTKNTIDFSGSKTLINAAFFAKGDDDDDNTALNFNIDFTLPDGDFGAIKYDFKEDDTLDGLNRDQSLAIEARGLLDWRNAKFSVQEILKNVDLDEDQFEYSYLVFVDDGDGRNVGHVDFHGKHSSSSENPITEEYKLNIYQHRQNDGLEAKAVATYNDFDGKYQIFVSSDGGRYLFDVNGNFDLNGVFSSDSASPLKEKITVEIKTPTPDLQHLKLDTDVVVSYPEGYLVDVKGSVGFLLNDNQWSNSENSANIKADGELKVGAKDTTFRVTAHSPRSDPITVSGKYFYDEGVEGKGEKYTSNIAINYERYKNIKSDVSIFLPTQHEIEIDCNLESPQSPPTKMHLRAKESPEQDYYFGKIDVTTNNNKYELVEELDFRETSPGFKVQFIYPNRRMDEVTIKTKIPNDNNLHAEVDVQFHEINFVFTGRLDASVVSEEDFSVKVTANCPYLQINNFIADIQNQPLGSSVPENIVATSVPHLENRYDPYTEDPRYNDPRYTDPRYTDPRYTDPRYTDPRYTTPDPRYNDPRYTTPDPRYNDPRYTDPRYTDPRYTTPDPRYDDPRYTDPRYTTPDPRYDDPRYTDPRYTTPDPRYDDPRYTDPRYTTPDPRYNDPRYTDPRYTTPDPRYNDPRYPQHNQAYNDQNYDQHNQGFNDQRYDQYNQGYNDQRYDQHNQGYNDQRYDQHNQGYDDPRYSQYEDPRYTTTTTTTENSWLSSWFRSKRSLDKTRSYGQSNYLKPHTPSSASRYNPSSSLTSFNHGERIRVSIQHNGRNILSGSASYMLRVEGDKFTAEGTGTFRYENEPPRQHNYKIVQQKIYGGRDGGEGIEYTWNLNADRDVVEGKLKITNRELAFVTNVCETNSRCHLRVQADSKVFYISEDNFEIDQNAIFDFGYMKWSEIGFKNKISNHGNTFDASGEVYADNQINKYRYKVFSSDKAFETSLTTPQRVISLEGKVQSLRQNSGTNFNIDFYLNKNYQPDIKTSLVGVVDCDERSEVGKCNLELKFSHPALAKEFGIIYTSNYNSRDLHAESNLVLDVFSNPSYKLILTAKANARKFGRDGISAFALYEIKSQGLNIDLKYQEDLHYEPNYAREFKYNYLLKYHVGRAKYDNILTLQVNPRQALLLAKVLNKDVFNIDAKINDRRDFTTINANVRALGTRPSSVNVDATTTSLKCTVAHLDNPSERLEISLSALTSNTFDFTLKYFERGVPMNLLVSYIRVNDNDELDTVYVYDRENFRRLIIEPTKKEYQNFKRELEYLAQNAERELSSQSQQAQDNAKWNTPDFTALERYYATELKKIDQELKNDPTLRKIVGFVAYYLGPILEWVGDMFTRIAEINTSAEEAIQVQYEKLLQAYERELLPVLEEYIKQITDGLKNYYVSIEVSVLKITDEILEFYDDNEKEIREFAEFVVDSLEDVIVFSIKLAQQLERELTEELNKLYKEIKAAAVFDELESKLQQAVEGRPVPEEYIRQFEESVVTLQESVQHPKVKKLIALLADYIKQKLRRQPIDDANAIKNIIWAGYDVLNEAYSAAVGEDVDDFEISWEALYAIPKLIEAEISPLTYLLYGDWPDLKDLLDSITLDADDWTIPELHAVVAQGQYIFTFDGKQYTFPGICNYLLARDAVNGNFSIAGNYNNGQLSSITFADKYDTVTIRKGGHLLVNQAPSEYPVRKQHRLEVYRDYEGITISSQAGVKIVCGPELMVCGFHINGFYHAQLRGLLGNGNNEPYDDYTLPSGIIVQNAGDFANSYKLERHCGDARAVLQKVQRHPSCTRLFSDSSPLSFCKYFVDPKGYRRACDHGMATGVKNADLAIATAYAASCNQDFYATIPDNYVKCNNYEKPTRVDDEFRVNTPGRVADIVLVIDQDKVNEPVFRDLIRPLTTQLASALGVEGISDVDFHLIGYGGEYEKQPAHYTVEGKLSFKAGRLPNIQFTTPLKEGERDTFIEYLERLDDEIELLTGQDMVVEAYTQAKNIPFRAHAVKSIIVLNSKLCDEAQIGPLHDLVSLLLHDKQISVHLFTPIRGINPRDQTAGSVVGFDENHVFTISSPDGSKQRPSFDVDNVCIDFALSNRGNVFITNNFLQTRSKQQYIQVASKNIAKKLTNVEQWLDCKCTMVSAYSAQNKCTVSYSRKRETSSRQPTYGRYEY